MDTLRKLLKPSSLPASGSTPISTNDRLSHPPTPPAGGSPTNKLTIIELFQSQGCNSCPPANAYLISHLTPDRDANPHPTSPSPHFLLTYEVTYWDHLGWADTFGDPRWDARQRTYASALKQRSVFTPQVLVDGGARAVGSWRDVGAELRRPSRSTGILGMRIAEDGGGRSLRVGEWAGDLGGSGGTADVLAVWFEEQPADVPILSGENRGVTLMHRNVVRDIGLLGRWDGGEAVFGLPRERRGLRMVVLVQRGNGGEILGAVRT